MYQLANPVQMNQSMAQYGANQPMNQPMMPYAANSQGFQLAQYHQGKQQNTS